MASAPDRGLADMEGEPSLPRKNGELVFEAPWEGRAFGIAVALGDRGLYEWEAFRQRLIAEIASAQEKDVPSSYYAQWLAALEKLAIAKGLVTREELDGRTDEYASGNRSND